VRENDDDDDDESAGKTTLRMGTDTEREREKSFRPIWPAKLRRLRHQRRREALPENGE